MKCINASSKCLGPITALGMCRSCYKRQYRVKNFIRLREQEMTAWRKDRPRKLAQLTKFKRSPKGRYGYMKSDSKDRGLSCTLTLTEYASLISNPCFYCKEPLPVSRCTGLDRIDNSKGYDVGNVLPCCGDCNYLRMHKLTVDETQALVLALKQYRASKKGANQT